jgi:hypothetical protein
MMALRSKKAPGQGHFVRFSDAASELQATFKRAPQFIRPNTTPLGCSQSAAAVNRVTYTDSTLSAAAVDRIT